MTRRKIGVFVCHCGRNIAETVDVESVAKEAMKIPGVAYATTYKYMCSDPGQRLIIETIKEQNLDAVVVAACSPSMHLETFRNAAVEAGLNKFSVEMANIREQSSWVHESHEEATAKAKKIIRATVEKVRRNEDLLPIEFETTKKALVIGGGIAGIQAALDIADAGYPVILVEKNPSIGGHMAQLSETFPTLDCSQCILTPKMVAAARHPNIKIYTNSEVEQVSGYVGNFDILIRKKARYVDESKCTACGDCSDVCPSVALNEFDRNMGIRKAIYIPFPQAVPATYILDPNTCLGLNPMICGKCRDACGVGAIDYDMQDELIRENVGAIVVATGYDLYGKENLGEFGYGKYDDVIDSLQFERLISSSGPTEGILRRPSDGKVPKTVVFVQCAGSRDVAHNEYCSKICCMYTAKHALLYKHMVPDGKAYIFYIDVRTAGKDYEEFYERVQEEGVIYVRGKVATAFKEGDKIVVYGADTLTGKKLEIKADLVVLAMAVVPQTKGISSILKIPVDQHGFFKEVHPKLRPVESATQGIFAAGAVQGPKDIPETVAQASAAASKALGILSQSKLIHEPTVAEVDPEACSSCRICVSVCPYGAITMGKVAEVNEVLCEGCGTCVAACPSGALSLKNLTDEQVYAQIESILR